MTTKDIEDIKLIKDIATKILFRHHTRKSQVIHFKSDKIIYFPGCEPTNLDNSKTDFKAVTKEKKMPPKYKDGSFSVRKNGLLKYRFKHNGDWVYKYGRSKQECWDKRTEHISGKGKPVKQYKFESVIKDWYNRYRKNKQNETLQQITLKQIDDICKVFGKKDIRKITTDELQDYANSLKKGRTREVYMGLIKAVFKKNTPKLVKINPCDDLEIIKHHSKPHPVIQLSDQRRIYECEQPEFYKRVFMIYCCTGLRLSELFNNLDYIDFENGCFDIKEKDTSTKKHSGHIPFLPELIDKSLVSQLKKTKPAAIQSHFKRLFKSLGIDATIHSFRVTFISSCNHININPKQIQAWARHRKIGMTMDTYAKLLRPNGTSPILEYLKRLKTQLGI